jgi:hypothetical protein
MYIQNLFSIRFHIDQQKRHKYKNRRLGLGLPVCNAFTMHMLKC